MVRDGPAIAIEITRVSRAGLTDIPSSSMHNGMGQARIAKDLVAASATPLVLAILHKAPSYGYAIIQEVRALSGGELEWSEGMLYPVLHRLEDQGLIESYEERGETNRKRRYYRLRPDGRRALADERRQWEVVHAALAKAWRAT
jgi:PadR family transcriptional regulator, regulatory protein PadR